MSILAALLVALGLTDVVRAEGSGGSTTRRVLGTAVGIVVLVLVGVFGDLSGAVDVGLLVVAAVVLVGWVLLSSRAVTPHHRVGAAADRLGPALALGVPAVGGLVLVACSGSTSAVRGPLRDWLHGLAIHGAGTVSATHALLLGGALLVQLGTGNVIVRLVLASVGAIKPAGQPQASDRLKGGRLLGPMERVVILGLGLAGQLTAAGIVIAAKGLIRWPELQARSRDPHAPSIDEVTEYFLVGSFVSWLVALGSLWVSAAP